MKTFIENYFKLKENKTTVKTEFIGGVTTFVSMCYIIAVEPALLSLAGMDFGAVMVATCLAAAFGTLVMGLVANYPIALAAAMGHNVFFTFTVCGAVAVGGLGYSWQAALAAVLIAGLLYLGLTVVGVREKVMTVLPLSLKHGIAAGIGLFIAFIGFQWGGFVRGNPATLTTLGDVHQVVFWLTLIGVLVIAALMAMRVKTAMIIGVLVVYLLGLAFDIVAFEGIVSMPPSLEPTFLKFDFVALFSDPHFLEVIFIFLFLNLFDTIGTLIGVSSQAGFLDQQGNLPRADKALQADASSAVVGATLGCSTVTSYIESSTGVAVGARTGLANVFTALLFLLSIVFFPLIHSIGNSYMLNGVALHPVIAPALIIVGALMIKSLKEVNWDDMTEAIPAFLVCVTMPFTFSITEGISVGVISYVVIKAFSGKSSSVHWLLYVFAAIFVLRYLFLLG